MIIPIEEQETVINYNRNDKYAEIYTTDTTVMTKLDKRVKSGKDWKLVKSETSEGRVVSKTYQCPKRLVSFRGTTVTREMTPEQKALSAERLRIAREEKAERLRIEKEKQEV